jgi:hypothetical protein
MKRAWAAFAALLATGCGTVVRSDVGDLDASDAAPDSSLFERDAASSMDATECSIAGRRLHESPATATD